MRNRDGESRYEIPREPPVDSETAAAYLNIHYKTLERMARMGEVPATKSGRSWQYLESLLSKWLKERMNSNLDKHRPQTSEEEKEDPSE